MISIQHEGKLTVVGVFGEFGLADYRRFEGEVLQQLSSHGQVDLMIDLRDMVDYTLDVAMEDIRFTRQHRHDIGRIAILSERDSVAWMALLSQMFLDAQLRVFDDEATARDWLAGS